MRRHLCQFQATIVRSERKKAIFELFELSEFNLHPLYEDQLPQWKSNVMARCGAVSVLLFIGYARLGGGGRGKSKLGATVMA